MQPVAKITDLSHHNKEQVQFGAMKKAGIEAVILKATQGTYRIDPMFEEYAQRAQSVGLQIGAYHFMTGEDATKQLDWFLAAVEEFRPLVLCLDYEGNPNPGGDPTPSVLSSMVRGMVKRLSRHPVLYGSDGAMLGPLLRDPKSDPLFKKCRRWIARYGPKPPKTPCDIWQFTDKARISGYGPFDANAMVGTEYPTVESFWKRFEI